MDRNPQEIISKFKKEHPGHPLGTEGTYCDKHRAKIISSKVPPFLFEATLVQSVAKSLGGLDKLFEDSKRGCPHGCLCCLLSDIELASIFKQAKILWDRFSPARV